MPNEYSAPYRLALAAVQAKDYRRFEELMSEMEKQEKSGLIKHYIKIQEIIGLVYQATLLVLQHGRFQNEGNGGGEDEGFGSLEDLGGEAPAHVPTMVELLGKKFAGAYLKAVIDEDKARDALI